MTYLQLIVLFLFLSLQSSCGETDPRDAYAINSLYLALGSPPIPGWSSTDSDPCGHAWQGVECVFSNITAIKLPGENLGGQLGGYLEFFNSIITIDLSDNHIGGSIPPNLPMTMRIFSLSANQFTGIIPDNLFSLSQLTDLSLNNNHFTGNLPDAFQSLKGLTNLDLSSNSLGGPLPPSMRGLSSLTSLNLQNNQLSGMLDIIQDLPLINLNIENNLFSGPIPNKLLTIPNFRRNGNPFNTTLLPSPPLLSPPGLPPGLSAGSAEAPLMNSLGPSSPQPNSSSTIGFFTTKRMILIGVGGAVVLAIITLVICFFMSNRQKEKHVAGENSEKHDMGLYSSSHEKKKTNETFLQQNQNLEEGMTDKVIREEVGHDHKVLDIRPKPKVFQEMNGKRADTTQRHDAEYQLDMKQMDVKNKQPFQPASLLPAIGEQLKNLKLPLETAVKQHSTIDLKFESSIKVFTVGSLQQYTNSFSQGNLVGRGIVGSVYRAKLPDGKLLAIKKVDTATSGMQSGDEFLVLVSSISKLQHPNIVKLVGYCAEHGQHLLAYDYCRNGSLYDALHLDDEMHDKLTWSHRIQIALCAARTLEYLHEICHPPIVHKNFKSANLLLDDKLTVHLSDCGLTSLMSTGTLSQLRHLSAAGYGAPELELGSYTHLSDIYSFGIVMLELLTGRKSFDRSLPRGEQFLVGWAMPQLHDIDSLSRMVDPSLKGSYSSKSLSRFADTISLCIQPEPEFRPPMSEIVQSLLHMIERELSVENHQTMNLS